ncbi:MAG: hypothetical protein MUF49_08055 [Oculatellaceae cyanobacterium Prado106]|jgi:hypothetical protein|nr:hypothetical protein [Oculatellaceae cyanobacterium Prado106]
MVSLEPIIHLIQHHIPAAQITLLSSSPAHAQSLPQVSHWPIHLDTQNPSWPVGINWILELHHRPFDAVLLLTPPGRSPYALAYACYLANIPLRFGQSLEFGGGLLSTWVKPPLDPPDCLEDYYLHLVRSVWGQMGWDGGTQMNTDKHR